MEAVKKHKKKSLCTWQIKIYKHLKVQLQCSASWTILCLSVKMKMQQLKQQPGSLLWLSCSVFAESDYHVVVHRLEQIKAVHVLWNSKFPWDFTITISLSNVSHNSIAHQQVVAVFCRDSDIKDFHFEWSQRGKKLKGTLI